MKTRSLALRAGLFLEMQARKREKMVSGAIRHERIISGGTTNSRHSPAGKAFRV